MVTCEPKLVELGIEAQNIEEPVLLIEVQSPTTEVIDHREERWAYGTQHSLKDYALVSQNLCDVELCSRRVTSGGISLRPEPDNTDEFVSIKLAMLIKDV